MNSLRIETVRRLFQIIRKFINTKIRRLLNTKYVANPSKNKQGVKFVIVDTTLIILDISYF